MTSHPSPLVPILVLHGGAGLISRELNPSRIAERRALRKILRDSAALLSDETLTAVDIVEKVVISLEECPFFNAGVGAVFNAAGEHEMDATIMDGQTKRCGAITGMMTTRNPIVAARKIMDSTPHIFLYGKAADQFAASKGIEQVENSFFDTKERRRQLDELKGIPSLGTVGAVCCDSKGNIAVATSTGGMTNKWAGRVGDSSIIGAGSYADNAAAAVSTTGHGESFIRGCIAYDVSARMKYERLSLKEAAERSIFNSLDPLGKLAKGGLIAVDAKGNMAMPFNSEGMYRGYIRRGEEPHVFVWQKEEDEAEER